jgi:hypothetical protein
MVEFLNCSWGAGWEDNGKVTLTMVMIFIGSILSLTTTFPLV